MKKTLDFPLVMPDLEIVKKDAPFFSVRCEEDFFIIPRIGNKCSHAQYNYPDRNLFIVSTTYVPKKAVVHEVEGVKICRDTYNVASDYFQKDEKIWVAQLTADYIRGLACINGEGDLDYPTEIHTFLDEHFDMVCNGGDRVNGMPILIEENPALEDENGIHVAADNTRYTFSVYDVRIGQKTFECIRYIYKPSDGYFDEYYIDRNGRIVLFRRYNCPSELTEKQQARMKSAPRVMLNGKEFVHTDDSISEYVL